MEPPVDVGVVPQPETEKANEADECQRPSPAEAASSDSEQGDLEDSAHGSSSVDLPPVQRNSEAEQEDETCFVEEEGLPEHLSLTPLTISPESIPTDSPVRTAGGIGSEDLNGASSAEELIVGCESKYSGGLSSPGTNRASMNSVESLQLKNALLYKNLSEICSTDRFGFSLKDGFRHSLPKTSSDMSKLQHRIHRSLTLDDSEAKGTGEVERTEVAANDQRPILGGPDEDEEAAGRSHALPLVLTSEETDTEGHTRRLAGKGLDGLTGTAVV